MVSNQLRKRAGAVGHKTERRRCGRGFWLYLLKMLTKIISEAADVGVISNISRSALMSLA
jgi:hypothetical protein